MAGLLTATAVQYKTLKQTENKFIIDILNNSIPPEVACPPVNLDSCQTWFLLQ